MTAAGLDAAIAKLQEDGATDATVASFAANARRFAAGDIGVLHERDMEPVTDVPDADALPAAGEEVHDLLDRTVVLKLNGGLGTSMGMAYAKSLLPVKDGLSFLDITARQVLALRARFPGREPRLPLLLMNSFRTRADSLAALAPYGPLSAGLPPDILQSRVPKLLDDGTLAPAAWPGDSELEWAPPGHGDLYPALTGSGALTMLEQGYRYASVANADNLGALPDGDSAGSRPRALPHGGRRPLPRRPQGRAPGAAAGAQGGSLVLREVADGAGGSDAFRHRAAPVLQQHDLAGPAGAARRPGRRRRVELPMTVNRKTVDPPPRPRRPWCSLRPRWARPST